MISLRRVNRGTPKSGFITKYISLFLAATMALLLWGYNKIYSQNPSQWLLYLAIGIAVLAFALSIAHIVKIWVNHRKDLRRLDSER